MQRITASILMALVLLTGCTTTPVTSSPEPSQLIGVWKVDLRPDPAAEGYYQEFVVTSVQGKSFSGTFYGAPITQARMNTDWGAIRIAFVTADGSGAYNHSAVLAGDTLEGLTNSTGRDFLSYWSATKKE